MRNRERKDRQFEISPEMIEQELRHAVCEHRQTDLRRIIVQYRCYNLVLNLVP